ncbi:hypothetical protein [Bdellovibrio svalbardensis]|uniref:Uncharacterized protein n=1 Tax=Bdellovibrio svalbardensis TaxID=2972972 RepID=A0ABT6DI52_9BACT|nr:hypothetical protein [Bdellovibrio svalbardensis]MDG0816189.1 hypothetical protein [Bdellovibrio svalbardensis]
MKHKSLRLGFDVTMEKGTTWKPLQVQFWNQETDFKKFSPSEPFKYMADALTALSLVKLNNYIKSPVATPHLNYSFALDAWKNLDPHIELYERSQGRIRALQSHLPVVDPKICAAFEHQFNESFDLAMKPWGVDLSSLCHLLETFSWFEKQVGSPFLYNFGLNFSKPFMEKLHCLYSFLYHLRGIVAVDHNAHVADHSHEAVKVDAISDYLPRAEYIVNDALLYWNFKKFSQPFAGPKTPDTKVEKLFVDPMEKAFHKYSHNACHLVNNLPKSFVNSLNPVELEEALYLVQMDWLLGSPAGLCFKIREELFGLQSGYEKIFWKDVEPKPHAKPFALHLCCELTEEAIYGAKAA